MTAIARRACSEFDGARECAIEFHSLSKTYSMTGWRVGFAVGNAQLVGALGTVKTNMDSGVFQAVQEAAIAALTGSDDTLHEYCAIYQERRDLMVAALRGIGLECEAPRATFYLWAQDPQGSQLRFVHRTRSKRNRRRDHSGLRIRQEWGGYVRFSLTVPSERLQRGGGTNQSATVVNGGECPIGLLLE